jgi:hypothetical protein
MTCRAPQHVDRVDVPGRFGPQQMHGGPFRIAAGPGAPGEHPGGPGMPEPANRRAHPVIEGGRDDRLSEPVAVAGEQSRGPHRVGQRGGRFERQPGQVGRVPQPCARAEQGQRPRQVAGAVRQVGEELLDPAPDPDRPAGRAVARGGFRFGPDRVAGPLRRSGPGLLGEDLDQERVAAGRLVAGADEGVPGGRAGGPDQRGRRRQVEGGRAQR